MSQKILDEFGKPLPSSDPMLTVEGQLAFMQMMVIGLVKQLGGRATVPSNDLITGGPYGLEWHSKREPTVHVDLVVTGPDGKPIKPIKADNEQPVHLTGKLN